MPKEKKKNFKFRTKCESVEFPAGPHLEWNVRISRVDGESFVPKAMVRTVGDKIIAGIIAHMRTMGDIGPDVKEGYDGN